MEDEGDGEGEYVVDDNGDVVLVKVRFPIVFGVYLFIPRHPV